MNLRNKEFYFLNEKYSKDEYFKKLKNLELEKFPKLKNMRAYFLDFTKKFPHKFSEELQNQNCSGNYISNSKNSQQCWDVTEVEDCHFCDDVENIKSSYDVSFYGGKNTNELLYECEGVGHGVFEIKFSKLVWGGASNCDYCWECFSCQDCFGCTGLKRQKYCILNKQYSKEEYFILRDKIIEHMKKSGEWGEFFPIEISPFAYNEAIVNEYFPLTKEEVLSRGWKWKDEDKKDYQPQTIIISDSIEEIQDSICKEILACEDCKKNYQIQKAELKFYKKMGLPIPRTCPDCRHAERMKLRNPRKLWNRKCDKCGIKIQTTFAPERPEKVYCEKCYLESLK